MYAYEHKQWWGSCTAYTVSKQKLRNIFWCYLRENLLIWNTSEKCETCERLEVISERCDSYIWYKVFFYDLVNNVNFWPEVAAVKKKLIERINRKITLAFHYFACIEKNASQLFFPGDVENINQAIDIYEKYDKKLLPTFYLLIKFFLEKSIPEEKNIKLLIKNTKKELPFLLRSKNLDRRKRFW